MLIYRFLGSGGVCPLPYRYLASLFVQSDTSQILIDCGECTQVSAKENAISLFNLDAIFLTHLHSDHVLGIPGLLASLSTTNRVRPLYIYGPPGTNKFVSTILKVLYNLNFEVRSIEIVAGTSIEFESFIIKSFEVQHSITCFGYRIEVSRSPEYKEDVVTSLGFPKNAVAAMQAGYKIEMNNVMFDIHNIFGEDRDSITLVYATDTGYCDKLIDGCKNSDIVILDGSYGDDTQIAKTNNTKDIHMTFEQAAIVAREANAKSLILTHFSPTVSSPDKFLKNAVAIFPNTICAYDGLKFDDSFTTSKVHDNIPTLNVSSCVVHELLSKGRAFVKMKPDFDRSKPELILKANDEPVIKVRVEDFKYMQNSELTASNDSNATGLLLYVKMLRIISGGCLCQ